jgi:hypothetical protein
MSSKVRFLTRDEILSAPDAGATHEDVSVPEWGGTVRVKALSGLERDQFEASLTIQTGRKMRVSMDNVRARLVALALIDAEGKQVLQPSDVKALGQKSAAALDRVFSVAQRLAGLGQKDIEELTENF